MKILVVAFAWNEIKHIARMVNFYKDQGCDLNIVDNCSTDGTFEYLKNNGVRTRQKDTNNSFDLITLQRCLVNDLKAVKPDWVVYTGIDVVYLFNKSIRETIERADALGFNMISIQYMNMYNTGEGDFPDLHKHYFYGRFLGRLYMIAKYSEPFGFEADSIKIEGQKTYPAEGILVNYGNCKPAAEREDTFRRRRKAWNAGLDQNYGVHYIEGSQRGWKWDKKELIDIRETEYYKYIKKL